MQQFFSYEIISFVNCLLFDAVGSNYKKWCIREWKFFYIMLPHCIIMQLKTMELLLPEGKLSPTCFALVEISYIGKSLPDCLEIMNNWVKASFEVLRNLKLHWIFIEVVFFKEHSNYIEFSLRLFFLLELKLTNILASGQYYL